MSDPQPRIAPLPLADRTEEQRALLTTVLGDHAPNLFTTVVRHPRAVPHLASVLPAAADQLRLPATGTGGC